jgi:hypothetical protein
MRWQRRRRAPWGECWDRFVAGEVEVRERELETTRNFLEP